MCAGVGFEAPNSLLNRDNLSFLLLDSNFSKHPKSEKPQKKGFVEWGEENDGKQYTVVNGLAVKPSPPALIL